MLCGRAALCAPRYRDDRPVDVCFARGTFNAHPYVMGAMQVFLERVQAPAIQAQYKDLDKRWTDRAAQINHRLKVEDLPVRVEAMSSVWTICYAQPSRYNWMLQYYLRSEGLALSWVGTGRLIFSLNFTDDDFDVVADRFVRACRTMRQDGWWWAPAAATNKSIRRQVLREVLAQRGLIRA